MLNKTFIQGNLVKDPDYRETNKGQPVCSVRLASSRKFSSNGQIHEETVFVKVECYGKLATTARQFLSKGSAIIFVGRLKLNTWQSKDGKQQSELVIAAESMEFPPKSERSSSNPPRPPQPGNNNNYNSDRGQYAPPPPPDDYSEVAEEDMPF